MALLCYGYLQQALKCAPILSKFSEPLSSPLQIVCRYASKKSGTSTRNRRTKGRPHYRGLKVGDGKWVPAGSTLVEQQKLLFHPGLNVGLGRDGKLFAIEAGIVSVTSEKVDLNLDHQWVKRIYEGRDLTKVHKKYVNIIVQPQHNIFKLIDTV